MKFPDHFARLKKHPESFRALIGFLIGCLGIAVGLLLITPVSENFGVLFAMGFSVVSGIFYTKYSDARNRRVREQS